MENCSFEGINAFVHSLHLAVYIPIFIVGIILNVLALIVFCRVLKKWIESTIYMTNLALMDLLMLLILPFRIYTGTMQKTFCTFLETLYFIGMYGSIFTIVCICVDRYIAIKHPFHATTLRSPKKAFWACAIIWVFVWFGSIPVYDFHSDSYSNIRCFHNFSKTTWNAPVIIAVELFGFIIPMVVLVVCSVEIIKTLQKKNSHRGSVNRRACVRIIYANLLVFLVSFAPSHLGIFLQYLVRRDVITDCRAKQNISLFVQVSMCLSNVTCCLDSFCYYFVAKETLSTDSFRRTGRLRNCSLTTEV
ncbi:G-protein coupled receptor 55-like [Acipenser oxyrinchus oxyrinchus]|uniref:G-protein coupled receptor 55-like n=1 Tax=Acipenser oxyrinchus oxyrinchus TaxID=40147 RepID=A0AAD8DFQ4_ACIOX|nr:G-protein coupled receptor 55-like [Acipenser oxyrinchus oxyrinchus]